MFVGLHCAVATHFEGKYSSNASRNASSLASQLHATAPTPTIPHTLLSTPHAHTTSDNPANYYRDSASFLLAAPRPLFVWHRVSHVRIFQRRWRRDSYLQALGSVSAQNVTEIRYKATLFSKCG
jgi:hypothetical protein